VTDAQVRELAGDGNSPGWARKRRRRALALPGSATRFTNGHPARAPAARRQANIALGKPGPSCPPTRSIILAASRLRSWGGGADSRLVPHPAGAERPGRTAPTASLHRYRGRNWANWQATAEVRTDVAEQRLGARRCNQIDRIKDRGDSRTRSSRLRRDSWVGTFPTHHRDAKVQDRRARVGRNVEGLARPWADEYPPAVYRDRLGARGTALFRRRCGRRPGLYRPRRAHHCRGGRNARERCTEATSQAIAPVRLVDVDGQAQ